MNNHSETGSGSDSNADLNLDLENGNGHPIKPAPPAPAVAPPPLTPSLVEFRRVSKWYGNIIGLNNLTCRISPGITGLLGPNGAGKSTFLQLATGQLRPSQGEVYVLGRQPWSNPALNRWIGLCPEQDSFYEWMSGLDFVTMCARLSGFSKAHAREAAARAIENVGMTPHRKRAIRGYSKGMRQRTKIAQALVHEPLVLFLDEPMTGTDPVARREILDLITKMGEQGKSVIVSSHVLFEVEAITSRIVLINRGRMAAEGNVRQIRDLIDKHPHRIVLHSPHARRLASELATYEDVVGIELNRGDEAILVETRSPDVFYSRLSDLALRPETRIDQVYSDDDNLEAVFRYLVNK